MWRVKRGPFLKGGFVTGDTLSAGTGAASGYEEHAAAGCITTSVQVSHHLCAFLEVVFPFDSLL